MARRGFFAEDRVEIPRARGVAARWLIVHRPEHRLAMSRDVDHLLTLLDLEWREEERRHAEERQQLTLKERVARGTAISDLEAVDERWGLGGRIIITFERSGRQPIEADLSAGSTLQLQPRHLA